MKTPFFLIVLSLLTATAFAEPWGPWSVNSDAPVILTAADRDRAPRRAAPAVPSVAATPFTWLLGIYQNHVSTVDGDRCPLYPTCSQYSVLAIRKHGPVIGIIMTADRLIHEGDEQQLAPRKKVGNRDRFFDPLENNDFWWSGK